jgi:hypothetical protein
LRDFSVARAPGRALADDLTKRHANGRRLLLEPGAQHWRFRLADPLINLLAHAR